MQQLPSSGQVASVSMSSQSKAKKLPTHSPRHGFRGLLDGGCCFDGVGRGGAAVADGVGGAVVGLPGAKGRLLLRLMTTKLGGGCDSP